MGRMTRAEIKPGSCGEKTTVEVEKKGPRELEISMDTRCHKIEEFASLVQGMEWTEALEAMCESRVYRAATRARLHPSCCVPPALIRAIEIELGAAVPEAMRVEFQ